ncbi:MAG: hypothetical protein LBQ12_11780 [Deltaproteobacteria bacterium]|nr:hypothetical protein [Deltaproteobacteria bacterium]
MRLWKREARLRVWNSETRNPGNLASGLGWLSGGGVGGPVAGKAAELLGIGRRQLSRAVREGFYNDGAPSRASLRDDPG